MTKTRKERLKQERQVYVALAEEIGGEVCLFCLYHSGCGGCCTHRLADRIEFHWLPLPGGDCWGFRPARPVSEVADIVGVCLANFDLSEAVGWYEDFGQLIVAGTKRKEVMSCEKEV